MQPTYFHCASMLLGPGSVICPGNWGRIKHACGGNGAVLARELGLERIRAEHYSTKPSRLSSAFVSKSLPDAEQFRNKHALASIVYEVSLVEPGAPSHEGDYDVAMQGFVGLRGIETIAHKYWRGDGPGPRELLTLSPLRIIRCVDSSAPDVPGLKPEPAAST